VRVKLLADVAGEMLEAAFGDFGMTLHGNGRVFYSASPHLAARKRQRTVTSRAGVMSS
jgi:hypothetical protein